MKPWAYYNEIDPFACAWLRELIKENLIAPGEVDERDIKEVQAEDLKGFAQAHWFAGIGVWSHALRRAGWPDDRPCWTGSCPCQPFSASGKRQGFKDERHLWPEWLRLIEACRPTIIFGEQVGAVCRGTDPTEEEVPLMWHRENLSRIFQELKRRSPECMQRVLKQTRAYIQEKSCTIDVDSLLRMEEYEARLCIGERSEISSQAKRDTVQSRSKKNSGRSRLR